MKYAVKVANGWAAWDHTDPLGQGGSWTVVEELRDTFPERWRAELLACEYVDAIVVEV